jgi:heptosyltransferase-2
MKLLIEPPTWLGDAVMASGAIKALLNEFKPQKSIIFGSFTATELLKEWFDEVILIDKKHKFKQFMDFPKVDTFISFRTSFYSKILGVKAKKSFYFYKNISGHMVEKYSKYVNGIINKNEIYSPVLPFGPKRFQKPTLGINPGATYGSAKRWYPEEFAKVANELAEKYDVIIFGGPGEEDIAKDIEKKLTVSNYKNLCGKLSIQELCEYIGGLDLFITNDSGPMHIAAAYNVPIVAIFGPTNYKETSPWSKNYKIVTKELECAPCMKRECPLGHHECMKEIKAEDVLKAVKELV